ncbi:dihydrofolate reductase family protein [Kribbella albertanoniae]|uniref:Riboflavin biosynthesis protein RibD n=1 Tax=Kribbella albertanoniae TaxID=1266829 RepID=A0A4R4P2L9_9ACTN|nr:dihydrofolate reductase family protein [Kribbella albertanoniae]TDC14837.1 riboflavin biosynthesis protein RibD [Kribbella albertanoniae]
MSSSVLLMSMSLDGYIAGPNDVPGNPGGDGFMRLHDWYQQADGSFGRPVGPEGSIWDELHDTGAVFVGRRTAEQVDYYGGTHHGVPLFVLTRREPDPLFPQVHFVTDVAEGMAAAKAAAGDRDVLVHGASAARAALEAGVLDELQIDQVPVLLGAGRRLFDVLPERIELEIARVIDTPAATHLRYRVVR